ncbi:hypothetical protein GQ43DRAFT_465793 [Delitschia confertaspora ATCC 74209]|uniref:DUF7580 domain-containing protein n=1 Tax=Delitschia confertaspora ATCC 74209 TaxID=1513339 RepID=A0A9P4MSN5_9PLEO|nr:hypothetical protein GQ43DRAFT_465793 [Delitschia confertaspora ATCC 74209]
MSGLEIIGVVLGALPLFIELGKAATSNANNMIRAFHHINHDDQLRDFYIGFYKETVFLRQQIVKIINALPFLSEDRKTEVKQGRHTENWTQETDVAKALEAYFSPEDFSAFLILMERLLKLFAQLVKDRKVHLSREDKDNETMYKKLTTFIEQQEKQTTSRWHEAKVTIKASRFVTVARGEELTIICDAMQNPQHTSDCLQLLVEDHEIRQKVWQLNWRPSQFKYLQSQPAISFDKLLRDDRIPSLMIRRKLAKVFAYSLFQLHESPWLSRQWDKDHIHFFITDQGKPDLERPFLSTSFESFPSGSEPLDPHCFHQNLGILKLGILLIEVHKWQQIEDFRTAADLVNGNVTANTDMQVAERTLAMMDDCYETYRGAIRECLKADWASAGSRVSLEDVDTWKGVYKDVIEPLEIEMKLAGASLADLRRFGL